MRYIIRQRSGVTELGLDRLHHVKNLNSDIFIIHDGRTFKSLCSVVLALCPNMCPRRLQPADVCATRLEEGNANRFRFPVLSWTTLPPRRAPSPPRRVSKQFALGLFPLPRPAPPYFHKPNPTPCLVKGRFSPRILRNEWRKRVPAARVSWPQSMSASK